MSLEYIGFDLLIDAIEYGRELIPLLIAGRGAAKGAGL